MSIGEMANGNLRWLIMGFNPLDIIILWIGFSTLFKKVGKFKINYFHLIRI